MNLQYITHHTLATDFLTPGGVTLDLGCRWFNFSAALQKLGQRVHAFDVQPLENVPQGVNFIPCAVSARAGEGFFTYNPTWPGATKLTPTGEPVRILALNDIYMLVPEVDLLKMDIEGHEYYILADNGFKPIPRQISVEFHDAIFPELHAELYDRAMVNLSRFYVTVQHKRFDPGCGLGYWDSLFIRKDLYEGELA